MKTRVDMDTIFDDFEQAVTRADLPASDCRRSLRLIEHARACSVGETLAYLMDSDAGAGKWDLHRVVDEARDSRIRAWRQGRGQPTREQELRLRMLWLLARLNEHFPGVSSISTPRPRSPYPWRLEDLMRQQRWQTIIELALERMNSASST